MGGEEDGVKDLVAYVRILWRHKWIVLAAMVIAIGGTLGVDSQRHRMYQGTATILFVSQNYTAPGEVAPLSADDVSTDIELVQGASVYLHVVHLLKSAAPRPTVAEVGATNTATITVTSPNATFAAKAANAYATSYIVDSRLQYLLTQQGVESQLQSQVSSIQSQISAVEGQIAGATGSALTPLNAQLGTLEVELQTHQTQLSQIQADVAQTPSGGRVVIAATVDGSPVSPKPVTDAALVGLLGLALGIALAFLRERTDDRIRNQEALEEVTAGLPTLGLIPEVNEWRDRKSAFLVEAQLPNSPSAEAYRGLRTSIQFLTLDDSLRTLQVTSPVAVEGKTTTAANLAVAMAQTGSRVVLVSCDLRRPRIHEFFGLPNDVGFTTIVAGGAVVEDALLRIPGYESLYLLPSGPVPPNPSELLGHIRARNIFVSLSESFDMVIVDSPPVMPVTDASVLATQVDGVLLVVVAGSTTRDDVRRSLANLGRVGARVIGLVLNKAPEADSYGYYRYGYSQKSAKAPPQTAVPNEVRQNGNSGAVDAPRVQSRRERRSG